MVYLDLDNFKAVNETMSMDEGDELLKTVAMRITDTCGRETTMARLGGDQFGILLEGKVDGEYVALELQRLQDALSAPYSLGSTHDLFVACSMGVSLFPVDTREGETLVKQAEAAMHHAKDLGGGGYRFFSSQMTLKASERMRMENALRKALDRGELSLAYQPKVELGQGRIIGMEALLRWNHPEWGFIPPDHFIPLAEESGLILPIGEWVLRTACEMNKKLQNMGLRPVTMAVNLSARQFGQMDLPQRVAAALKDTGLSAKYLELELTESMLISGNNTRAVLVELKDLGIELSIDDFGTGYSSLSYLKQFPVDVLKIDRAFISDLPDDQDDAAITSAIIAMAHSLNLKVLAEGAETEEHVQFLREKGCDAVQGYYFSRPLSEDDFVQFFKQSQGA